MHHVRNLLVFVLAASLLILGYLHMRSRYSPETRPTDTPDTKAKPGKKDEAKPAGGHKLQALPPPTTNAELLNQLTLGDRAAGSRFHLFVQLDPLAGGVRAVTLNKFKAADATGQPGEGPLE